MSEQYFVPPGDKELERLEILHNVFLEPTTRYLTLSGLEQASSIADIGCGTGEMTA